MFGDALINSYDFTNIPSKPTPKVECFNEQFGYILTNQQAKAEISFWRMLFDIFCGTDETHSKNNYFDIACAMCLLCNSDQQITFKMRKAGLKRLDQFLGNSSKREILRLDMKLLTWSCLNLLSYFYRKQSEKGCCDWIKAHRFKESRELFRNQLYLVMPERQREVVRHTMSYFRESQQWSLDEFVTLVFEETMSFLSRREYILAKLLKEIERNKKAKLEEEEYKLTVSLALILEHTEWESYLLNDTLHSCFNAMLKLYLLHNTTDPATKKFNTKIRVEIRNCIRNFITNVKENKGLISMMDSLAKCLQDKSIPEDDGIDLCEVIVFCAQRHKSGLYRESLTPDLLNFLMANLKSSNQHLVAVTHRILQFLLDRHRNINNFSDPVYYFKGGINLQVTDHCDSEDSVFFKDYSSKFFEGMIHCCINFPNKLHIIMTYTTICLILVEIPEPLTTINVVHFVVTIQNEVLKKKDISITASSHIHAILASIMFLICFIHKEEVEPLRKYVEDVISFRTENAPFLLPPLYEKYNIASHHTTEYHNQLYFLEDEILYSLQRCWLSKRTALQANKPLFKTSNRNEHRDSIGH